MAQDSPPVLTLTGDNNYTTHFDTQNKLTTQLLNTGVAGQATIEFWVMGAPKGATLNSTYSPWLFSNLLTGSKEFSISGSKDQFEVKLGSTNPSIINLSENSKLKNNEWHHIAMTFNVGASTLRIYVDGIQQGLIPYTDDNLQLEYLYLMITSDDFLSIAEYRAWNIERNAEQILANHLVSYYNQNATNLNVLLSNGLIAAYASNSFEETEQSLLPLSETLWDNIITSNTNTNIPKSSRVVSRVNHDSSIRLAELRIDAGHPIFGLEDVLLTASDGNESRLLNISGGNPGIVLKWPHINGATSYTISRRNVTDQSSLPSQISVKGVTSSTPISSYLDFFDTNVLPNEIYEYTVTSNLNKGKAGVDNGFVFSNGIINGKVATASGIASQDALMEVTTQSGVIPGSALQFNTESVAIGINDVSIFHNSGGKGSIEFWYRTPQTGTGSNTIYKLSDSEIRINESTIKVMYKSAATDDLGQVTEYLSATKPNDNEWHHYLFGYNTTGGDLYIDGGIQPTDGATTITPNATTTTPFYTAVNKASKFAFNTIVNRTYQIDEIRIWNKRRTAIEINKYKDHVIEGSESDLLAYYRLDLHDKNHIYNQALNTLGQLKGISLTELIRLTQDNQPLSKYGTYTDNLGRYTFNSLNAGRQSVSVAGNSLAFIVKPTKPNSSFAPEQRVKDIDRILKPEVKDASFTDISSLPISGNIVYRVPNTEDSNTFEVYPTVKSTGIKLNGTEVTSDDPTNQLVRTNTNGVYTISAPLGRHAISVGGLQTGQDEVVIGGQDRISLDFNGVDGYAVSNNNISVNTTDNFTWSGFIKPDVATGTGSSGAATTIPVTQTILHWGSIRLELQNNNQIELLVNGIAVLNKTITASPQYTFFAIIGKPTTNTISLLIDNDYQTAVYNGISMDKPIYLGATNSVSGTENFSKVNLDILEYRTQACTTAKLSDIKNGKIIADDDMYLKLSYTFEHRNSRRAISLVGGTTNENNFLSLQKGVFFNNQSTSAYRRDFKFKYKAIGTDDNAALINPENNTEYLFNVTEAKSGINFENTTRRSFIGNIVVPCDNSVGAWTGTITRTDVVFPEFSKTITATNFNTAKTVFKVDNLLPGQYKVNITKPGLITPLTASIDLRAGNKSYDFAYRNPMEAEIKFYDITLKEFEAATKITDPVLQAQKLNELLAARIMNSSCGMDNDIYAITTGKNILVTVSLFEDYNGSKCPINDTNVSLTGDMIQYPINTKTNALGIAAMSVIISSPNFIGDYLRDLKIAVSHNSRNLNLTKQAYITGAQRNNADFTLVDPTVGFVLFDPPGDESSATLERGSSYSFSKTVGGGLSITSDFSAGVGADVEASLVTLVVTAPLGVGTAQGISSVIGNTQSSTKVGINANATYSHSEQNGTSVSLNQSISTSSSGDIVGADADVFIGTSQVLTFGGGRELVVTNCTPSIKEDATVMTSDNFSPFVYTRQDIEDRIIRNLQDQLIKRYDIVAGTTDAEKAGRSSLDYQATIDGFNIDTSIKKVNGKLVVSDQVIIDYYYQIKSWKAIVKRETRAEQLITITAASSFASTTSDLKAVGSSLGTSVSAIDQEISFSGGTSTTYSLTRAINESSQNSGNVTGGVSTSFDTDFTIAGVNLTLDANLSISGVTEASDDTSNDNSRVDSFTLSDGDIGDQFTIKMARHKTYDTAMFYTVAGQSGCPFESGTQPREAVEITVDKNIGYGVSNGPIVYNVTLRNTQKANDATGKPYTLKLNGVTNSKGAKVSFNGTVLNNGNFTATFGLDGNSPTGVKQEITGELRIERADNAPEDVSYENLEIQFYSGCEHDGDGYRSYRVAEYEEVEVKPFDNILLTANFSGACVQNIDLNLPLDNWVVNSTDENELGFRFRIPELVNNQVGDAFSVLIEYSIPGNNTPVLLKKVLLTELKLLTDADTGYINYKADVSGLADGTYLFRVTPLCDDSGANLPANRQTPTAYITGTIARVAPVVVSTNPTNGGVLTDGQISVEFNSAINPLTVVNSAISLRGILGGVPADLISANFAEITDEVRIPHQSNFDLLEAFTIEMWVNPSSFPTGNSVPILQKGNNYTVALSPNGTIKVNDIVNATKVLEPFQWTHVSVIYDGVNTLTIYYNGVSVGSGTIQNLSKNIDPIYIAKSINSKSFIGKIDEVRIWSTVRTPVQIVSNMDEQLVGNEAKLEAYFVFDNNALQGVNGAADEAIRDFTGNAIGTTAVGLSFVNGEDKAAPLDITRIAKEIDFTLVTATNNTVVQINPVFTNVEIEGAQLTALIHNKKLQDPNGNKVTGTSWSFIVNRNTIQWSQNNIRVSQEQGTSTRITSMLLDNANGGISVDYKFIKLPYWLTVEKRTGNSTSLIADGAIQNIGAGQVERNLEFVVAPFLNPGTHTANVYIETYNAVTGVPTGVEVFQLEVDVFCNAPNFSEGFNSGDYIGNMNFIGKLVIDDVISFETGDIVAVYFNNEYRGSANVSANGIVDLAVFGFSSESGALTFKVWDTSECTEYEGIIENYSFGFRALIGTTANPVTFTVGDKLVRRISLITGFQQVSFNVRDNSNTNNLSFSSIKGLAEGDRIIDVISSNTIATVNAAGEYIFTGNEQPLNINKSYTIQATSSKTIEVVGIPVDLKTNIVIVGSNVYNAIPYFPNELQRTSYALRSLTSAAISNGDRIDHRALTAQYSSEHGWSGSLTHLTPGLGYSYRSTNNGVLNYTGIINSNKSAGKGRNVSVKERTVTSNEVYNELAHERKAKAIGWKVDNSEYLTFMHINGVLKSDDIDVDKSYIMAAFVDNKIRGVAKSELVDGEYRYYIGVGGVASENISFKIFDGDNILTLNNIEKFDRSVYLGDINKPFELNYSLEKSIKLNTETLEYSLNQNIPNPVINTTEIQFSIPKTTYVEITLHNLLGQKIETIISKKVEGNILHKIYWNKIESNREIESGIYLYRLSTDDKSITKKMIIK